VRLCGKGRETFSAQENRDSGNGSTPVKALSSFATARRNPRTSSFNLPVSLCFRSSYSSSFSCCKRRARCVRAVVTVFELVFWDATLFICGIRRDSKAGGRETESVEDGPGCLERYCRSCAISSYTPHKGVSMVLFPQNSILQSIQLVGCPSLSTEFQAPAPELMEAPCSRTVENKSEQQLKLRRY
jgi:hypothetical protein